MPSSQSNRSTHKKTACLKAVFNGGWGEIRTHGGVAPTPVFKTGAFNRSATHPIECRTILTVPNQLALLFDPSQIIAVLRILFYLFANKTRAILLVCILHEKK